MARPARRHHRDRQTYPPRSPAERRPDTVWIYGIHPVLAALANPRREVRRIVATPNALARLAEAGATFSEPPEETTPRALDRLLGGEAVHQGVAIEAAPLPPLDLGALADTDLIVVLDQVTDPHNVGAVMRSALAFAAGGLVTTARHAPTETGVLAKAASGALDRLPWVEVRNLARALAELGTMGFTRIGLDSEAEEPLDAAVKAIPGKVDSTFPRGIASGQGARADHRFLEAMTRSSGARVALVLGAEGKGLRRLTRKTCDRLARLPVPGTLASLNVSNAAVLALYLARRHLDGTEG